jgi:phosphopantetheinyl transferase (holo-ACP synthase)
MISTGNDIVALGSIDKDKTNEFRFYSKILSASEQALYQHPVTKNMPFENYVWLLWSVKESVYKYLKRLDDALLFSPTKIIIKDLSLSPDKLSPAMEYIVPKGSINSDKIYVGKATLGSVTLYFRSRICDQWINTVVNDQDDFDNIYSGVHLINNKSADNQSKRVRSFLLRRLKKQITGSLQISKNSAGCPIIVGQKREMPIPVSLAHHDYWVAYCFKMMNCGA